MNTKTPAFTHLKFLNDWGIKNLGKFLWEKKQENVGLGIAWKGMWRLCKATQSREKGKIKKTLRNE